MVNNVFITGATGCVGQYVVDEFANDDNYHLFLNIRDESKFKIPIDKCLNKTYIKDDLQNISRYKTELKKIDYVIHIATTWGGVEDVNIKSVKEICKYVDPNRIKKIILFSTASILGLGNKLLPEAEKHGTGYIKSKYKSYLESEKSALKDKIVHVFPTIVLGGDDSHPYPHVGKGLSKIHRSIKWLKYFYVNLGFHFIHADDIAKSVKYIIENNVDSKNIVLGNDYLLYKDFILQVAQYYGKKPLIQIKIPTLLIKIVIKLFRIKVSSWDMFSIDYKHFKYEANNFNDKTNRNTVKGVLDSFRNTNR